MSIVVRNWDRFQHADVTKRGRAPAWIKLYTEILSDENYLKLTPTRRAMLIGIWVEYARTRRELPDDTASLSRRLAQRVLSSDLEALNHVGFIEIRQDAVTPPSRLEKRREEKRKEDQPLPTTDLQVTSNLDDELAQRRQAKSGLTVNDKPVSSAALLASLRATIEEAS